MVPTVFVGFQQATKSDTSHSRSLTPAAVAACNAGGRRIPGRAKATYRCQGAMKSIPSRTHPRRLRCLRFVDFTSKQN